MEKKNNYLPWIIRIIIFILFMLSGIAKMFPIWAFEKQLVDLEIFNWCQAPYFARFIIALEMAIGISILQPHFLKRIFIPLTILLLVAFCIHLCIQIKQFGAMSGNCGCFGQLIPMTPLEALIKNIITIALLIYLYRKVSEKEKGQNKFMYPFGIFVLSLVLMFVLFPFTSTCSQQEKALPVLIERDTASSVQIKEQAPEAHVNTDVTVAPERKIDETKTKKDSVPVKRVVDNAPPKTISKFSTYKLFGDKTVNLDEGKKIVCMFAAGCDHCRAAAKEICAMSKGDKFPEVYVLFMDEETFLIDEFFKEAQCKFPYKVVDIPEFWNLLGTGKTTPGVFYLWNGNIIKSFEGLDKNKFDPKALKGI